MARADLRGRGLIGCQATSHFGKTRERENKEKLCNYYGRIKLNKHSGQAPHCNF